MHYSRGGTRQRIRALPALPYFDLTLHDPACELPLFGTASRLTYLRHNAADDIGRWKGFLVLRNGGVVGSYVLQNRELGEIVEPKRRQPRHVWLTGSSAIGASNRAVILYQEKEYWDPGSILSLVGGRPS